MPRQKKPDDANRPPLPEGYIYDKRGKPIGPVERLDNVINALFFEDFETVGKEFQEEFKRLPKEVRQARIERVKKIVDSVIREVTGEAAEPPAQNPGETEKRSWVKKTRKQRDEGADKQRE